MRQGNLAKGLVAGVAAGLLAALVMDQFQKAWAALTKDDDAAEAEKPKPATLTAADEVSKTVTGKVVSDKAQKAASSGVHYLMGAALGALYGAAAEFAPAITLGFGGVYGATVWLALDEGFVPALRLAPASTDVAAADHAYALASHLIFGVTLEFVRDAAGRVLGWDPIAG